MRDEKICEGYKQGQTQEELADRFELSKARVGQILKKAGLTPQDRPEKPPSDRTTFTGVNLSPRVKSALKEEVQRQDSNMSAWIADLVQKELASRGYDFSSPPTEDEPKLPL